MTVRTLMMARTMAVIPEDLEMAAFKDSKLINQLWMRTGYSRRWGLVTASATAAQAATEGAP